MSIATESESPHQEVKFAMLRLIHEAAEHARVAFTAPAMLSQDEAMVYCQVSKSEWHRLKGEGKIPDPVKIPGTRTPRWRRADLDAWIRSLPPFA